MKKKIISLSLAFCLIFSCSFAHSGRTDSSGGHRDNKNVSGLGYYHYHCGGYPAHLHTNGICPYNTSNNSYNNQMTYDTNYSYIAKKPSNEMSVELPTHSIYINNSYIDNNMLKYPFLTYNYITYLPLTWELSSTLGISYYYDNIYYFLYPDLPYKQLDEPLNLEFNDISNSTSYTVNKISNIKIYNNTIYTSTEYPAFNFRDINYIPLTFEIANKLNLVTSWDDNTGLDISTNPQPKASYLLKPGEHCLTLGKYNVKLLNGSGFLEIYDITSQTIYPKESMYWGYYTKSYENLTIPFNNKITISDDLLLLFIKQQ